MNIHHSLACGVAIPLAMIGPPGESAPARVPVLLYHSGSVTAPCDYSTNNLEALEQDLEQIHALGFTIVPAYWVAQWSRGERDLPARSVAITIDDGYDRDYMPTPSAQCEEIRSVREIFEGFRQRHDLPPVNAHVSLFVIGSPVARMTIHPGRMNENWWFGAQAHPQMEVYNHGTDHDHTRLLMRVHDPYLQTDLPVSGYADGNWAGELRPWRINTYDAARRHIALSAEYIASQTGVWPDLFAHPMGQVHPYVQLDYLPRNWTEHRTYAAFCIELAGPGPHPFNYVTRESSRWCLPRFTMGYSWKTPAEFVRILEGAR